MQTHFNDDFPKTISIQSLRSESTQPHITTMPGQAGLPNLTAMRGRRKGSTPAPQTTTPQGRTGHLMFPEDLAAPPAELGEIHATAAYLPAAQRTSPLVTEFLQGAINSALTERRGTLLGEPFQSSLTDWISAEKLDCIVISRPTVGHSRDFLLSQRLPPRTHTFIRSWDRLLWPHATAGFFKLKAALPKIHAALAPMRKDDLFPHV